MNTLVFKEVYGVQKLNNGKYAIVHNLQRSKWNEKILLGDVLYRLTYKKLEFAVKKADSFMRGLHKDFINHLGDQVHFEFENLGLVKLGAP